MTNFERELSAKMRQEATQIVPDSVQPPGLPAGSAAQASWLYRWRAPLIAAAAVAVIGASAVVIVGQLGTTPDQQATVADSGTDTNGPGSDAANDSNGQAPPRFEISEDDRAKDYTSLEQLAGDATHIAIVSAVGASEEAAASEGDALAPETLRMTAHVQVDEVVAGDRLAAGETIDVDVFLRDTSGAPALTAPGRYLVFLAPSIAGLGPDQPLMGVDAYALVGGLAGMFYQTIDASDALFQKLDAASTALPNIIDAGELAQTVSEGSLVVGWGDLEYLDHALAGVNPADIDPLYYPVLPPRTELIDNPADNFDCFGAETVAAAAAPEQGAVFGLTDDGFCVGTSHWSLPDGQGKLYAASAIADDGPIRALERTAEAAFDTQVGGLVDKTITGVRAIRGSDDEDGDDGDLSDVAADLYELGDYRAFVLPSDANTVVLYEGDAEVARAVLPVAEITVEPGEYDLFELRDDMPGVGIQEWSTWQRIDDATLRLYFMGGASYCYAAQVEMRESADDVQIAVRVGWKSEAGGCEDALHNNAVEVELAAPLGDREVRAVLL